MSEATTKARHFGINQLIPVLTALMAVAFIWLGLSKYGFWSDTKGPLPGFFPVVVAVAMLFVSLLTFVQSFRGSVPSWPAENWLVVLSAVLIIGGTFLIGMVPSLAVYVLIWLRRFEKCTWRTTLVTTAVIMAVVIGCFVIWLGVPFPKGLIYNAIFR
jgi:small-conductance mechanosensitive channel